MFLSLLNITNVKIKLILVRILQKSYLYFCTKVSIKDMWQGTIEMACWLKALDTKPDDLNPIPWSPKLTR